MIQEKSITLKQLRALAAIERAGSLTGASAVLNVTTPAVSTQLRTLEQNFDVRMLERGPDGHAELTEPGRAVLAAVEEIENALHRCYRRVEALRAGKAGHIALGVVSTAKYFAPRLVMQARQTLPGLDIELKIGNREIIVEALGRNEFDLAIMGRPPRHPPVEAHGLGDHPHVIIAAPDHPLAGRAEVTADELLAETFLTRELGSGTRILMERYLDRIGDGRTYERYELGTNETIKQAVIAGLGIALISAHTVTAEIESGRLVTLNAQGLPLIRRWFVVHRADAALTPAAARMRDFLISLEGAYLPRI